MPAVAFHLSVKPISRTNGKSAVAKAAYLTGEKFRDERTGKLHDYTRRGGVEAVLHAQVKDAPDWSRDIAQAWNTVEAVENRKNSTTAKAIDGLAFPHELTAEERLRVLVDWTREQLGRRGYLWTAAIHEPDKAGDARNHHAHVMWSERPLTPDGFAANKALAAVNRAAGKEQLAAMRERWAALTGRMLERKGLPLEAARWREGHKTIEQQRAAAIERGDTAYAERLAEREPTKHLGVATVAMERKGVATERGDAHRALEAENAQRQAVARQRAGLDREITRLAGKEERAAAYAVNVAKGEPETIRLYRGVGDNVWAAREGEPLYFSTNIERARAFGALHFVDVTRAELAQYKCPHSKRILETEPIAKDDYRIGDAAILNRLRPLPTVHQERQAEAQEQRRSVLAAKLGGLEDVQTLRGLWQSADNAAAFLAGTQAQGYTVARVTERDARMSRGEAQTLSSGDPSRTPPIYRTGELVAYNAQGFGFRLNGATLDDAQAPQRLNMAANVRLPTLADARQSVIEQRPEQTPATKRNLGGLARAAITGLVEFLFGWVTRRTEPQRSRPAAPQPSQARRVAEASKRADKSLGGARDLEANYGGRLLQLDPEIQDALRRAREAKERDDRERDDDGRGRER